MRRRGSAVALFLACTLVLCAAAPGARAATVGVVPNGVVTFGEPIGSMGETNVVTVSYAAGMITITDTGGSPLSAGSCTKPTPDTAVCPGSSLLATLGGLNDQLTLTSVLPGVTQIPFPMITGGTGMDRLTGGPGREDLFGDEGVDTLLGGGGGDLLVGGAEGDDIDGGEGNDDVEPARLASPGADLLKGGPGDDTFGAVTGATPPMGTAPEGGDEVRGGTGRDRIEYRLRAAAVNVTLDNVANDGAPGEGDNVRGDVEDVLGSAGNDALTGSVVANTLDGSAGEDVIAGAGGNDRLEGGVGDAGSDSLDGGDGNDHVTAGPGDDAVRGGPGDDTLDGQTGTDDLAGAAGADSLLGGAGIDSVAGGDGDDTVRGGAPSLVGADGADRLEGDAGSDRLLGDDGDDLLDGGRGADALSGGDGEDTAAYDDRFEGVTVSLDGRANDGATGEGDNGGRDVENVRGGRLDDTLDGDGRTNVLQGGPGEDYADGGAGPDDLQGGENGDVLRARDGLPDRVSCGPGPDFVIADPRDTPASDCDRVDSGRSRRPRLARTAVVQPLKGSPGFAPVGIRRTVPLKDLLVLPVRSRVNAIGGSVRVTSARSGRGRQVASLSAGHFQVLQTRRSGGLTDIVMKGGDFGRCRGASSARGANASQRRRSRRVIRRLKSRARGRFRTRGRYSAATVRGTDYEVLDRCDGTLTRVTRGRVAVRDLRRKRTVIVRAGRSYLARAAR